MLRPFLISIVVIVSPLILPASTQKPKGLTVSLTINEDAEQFSGQMIASRRPPSDFTYTFPSSDGLGEAPGGVLFRIELSSGSETGHRSMSTPTETEV